MPRFPFPGLRLLGAAVVERVAQAPLLSVTPYPLRGSLLADFSQRLFGGELDAVSAASRLRAYARDRPDAYGPALLGALRPLVETARNAHASKYGFDVGKWDGEARSAVYHTDYVPPTGGHARVVVTFEPHPDPAAVVSSPTGPLDMIYGFPLATRVRTEDYVRAIRGGTRSRDGSVSAPLEGEHEALAEFNATQRRAQAPIEQSLFLLSGNNFVRAERVSRVVQGDVRMTSVLMATTLMHAMDGIVPWTFLHFADLPGILVCVSLHLGNHPAVGGDEVNAAISAYLFKLTFRRGALLSQLREEIIRRFGADLADRGLLSPKVRAWFEDRVASADWRLAWDIGCLVAMDATGGRLLAAWRLLVGGDTVSSIEVSTPPPSSASSYDETLARGQKRTKADGYKGPPTVVPAQSDAVVVSPASVASGSDVDPPGTPPQLDDTLRPFAERLSQLGDGVQWDLVETQVGAALTSRVTEAVDGLGDTTTRSISDVAAAIDEPELRDAVHSTVEATIVAAVAGELEYAAVSAALGDDAAAELTELTLADPLWERMTSADAGESYISASIAGAVAAELGHEAAQEAESQQHRLADLADTQQKTSGEIAAQKEALDAIQSQLASSPDDAALRGREAELEHQLKALEERSQQEQSEHEAAELAQQSDRREGELDEQAGDAAAEQASQRAGEVFANPGRER